MDDPHGRLTDASATVAVAREALALHDWEGAYRATQTAFDRGSGLLDADRLDVRAEAAWWLGKTDECIDAREAAYATYEREGASRMAAQCAVWLYEHHCFRAEPSIGGAWLRRARRHLEADVDCYAYGSLILREVEVAHGSGELELAEEQARTVIALGRRLQSRDFEAEALQTLGRVLIDQGHAEAGLRLLDEAMLSAIEGKLGPYTTVKVYCSHISACEELGDFMRGTPASDRAMATIGCPLRGGNRNAAARPGLQSREW